MKYTSSQRAKIMLCLCGACFVSSMTNSATAVSMPSIMATFQCAQTEVQALLTYYSMILGVMSACSAFLVNRFKTKKLFITCVTGFCITTAGMAFSTSIGMMLTFRILQAISAGSISTMALMIALQIFPEDQKGTGTGIIGMIMFASPALAPTITGFIIDAYGFRGVFLMLAVMLAVIDVLSIFFVINIERSSTELPKLDVVSVALYALGFAGFNFGMTNVSKYGIANLKSGGLLLIAVVLLIVFAVRNVKSEAPLLRLKLFASFKFTCCVFMACVIYLNLMLCEQMSQQYLQVIRGYSASKAGMIATAASILVVFVSLIGGKFYDKKGGKAFCIAGFLPMAVGIAGMTISGTWMPIALFALFYGIANLANGWLLQPMNAYLTEGLPAENVNHGVALSNSLRMIFGSVASNIIVSSASAFSGSGGLDVRGYTIAMAILTAIIIAALLVAVFGLKSAKE